jgi:flagellar capping protein FliD
MDKQIKIRNNNDKVIKTIIYPKIKGYNELMQKCDELSNKWQEIKQLAEEVEKMELPIEFYQSL